MGAIFNPPDPPLPAPPPIAGPDPEEEARKARLEALRRRLRGRGGTVRTSLRGVLQPGGPGQTGKKLLGE
jgi:hypothetical protein